MGVKEYTDEMRRYVLERLKARPRPKRIDIGRELRDVFGLHDKSDDALRIWVGSVASEDGFRKPTKRVFFDIETSPNIGFFWRTGYNLTIQPHDIIKERAIICICWKWENDNKVHSLSWKDGDDKEMLEKFSKVMVEADEIVGHNSDRFDIKWVTTRMLFHKIPALPRYRSLDTLKKARSHFNFNSNKLDYIARFLDVGGKIETGGFDLWKRITLDNDKNAMSKMVEYCKNDVIILEDVFKALRPYVMHNTNMAVMNGGTDAKCHCPNCQSAEVKLIKSSTTPKGTIKRWMECEECSQKYDVTNKVYMNFRFPNSIIK